MAPRTLKIQHWEGTKMLMLRDGNIPDTFDEFQALLASKVTVLSGLTRKGQLRFTYTVDGGNEPVDLEDDDDLEVMLSLEEPFSIRVSRPM
ncbi:hypothetical protein HDU93_003904, partial [Gonapodya sp. JEL0774]